MMGSIYRVWNVSCAFTGKYLSTCGAKLVAVTVTWVSEPDSWEMFGRVNADKKLAIKIKKGRRVRYRSCSRFL